MALQENFSTYSYEAGNVIEQYRLVAVGTAAPRRCNAAAVGALCLGATLNKATAAGQAITVANNGIVKVEAGGPITTGSVIASGAAGVAKIAAPGEVAVGVAITAATQAGEVIEVQWLGPWIAV